MMLGKQAKRALSAMAALVILGVGVVGADAVATGADDVASGALFSGRSYGDRLVSAGGGGAGAISEEVAALRRSSADAPSWVEAELVQLEEAGELWATDDWTTIGFSRNADAVVVNEWLEDQLDQRGWSLVGAGVDGVKTGVKEKGTCSWLWFSVAAVGGETCVVMQILAE